MESTSLTVTEESIKSITEYYSRKYTLRNRRRQLEKSENSKHCTISKGTIPIRVKVVNFRPKVIPINLRDKLKENTITSKEDMENVDTETTEKLGESQVFCSKASAKEYGKC